MKRILAFFLLALAATPAAAYVGPGAGLSLMGALWGLILAVVTALVFLALWPLRRYRRRKRQNGSQARADPRNADSPTTRSEARAGASAVKRQSR
ncbi:MAG: hypothetical protein WED00_13435 [Aquisalimonadaceae bacterium]